MMSRPLRGWDGWRISHEPSYKINFLSCFLMIIISLLPFFPSQPSLHLIQKNAVQVLFVTGNTLCYRQFRLCGRANTQ